MLAGDPRIPVGEHAARVVLPHPRVQPPELEGVVLLELLAVEQLGRLGVAAVRRIRDDVLHGHQAEPAVLLGLVEQQLGLLHAGRSVDQAGVAIVEAHAAGAGRIGHARRDLRRPPGRCGRLEAVKLGRNPAERGEILVHDRRCQAHP